MFKKSGTMHHYDLALFAIHIAVEDLIPGLRKSFFHCISHIIIRIREMTYSNGNIISANLQC